MSIRNKMVGGFVFAFITALLAWTFLSSSEPAYDGKPLSIWARQYGSNHWNGNLALASEAEYAIRQIGTNGIPLLLDLLRVRDSDWKRRLRGVVSPGWHRRLRLLDDSGDVRRIGAHGLAALGPNAKTAVPTIVEIAANHLDEDGRYIAVFALRTIGPAAESAIPFFIHCLTNEVSTIRDEGAVGLGSMHHKPEVVVPELVRYLEFAQTSRSRFECTDTIEVLGKFEGKAKAAVPILLRLLEHSDFDVRAAVTNSLPRIDADAAAKAQVKRPW